MKYKILILILSLLISTVGLAQFIPQSSGGAPGVKTTVKGAFKPDSVLVINTFPDTLTANRGPNIKKEQGAMILVKDTLYHRDTLTKRWVSHWNPITGSNFNYLSYKVSGDFIYDTLLDFHNTAYQYYILGRFFTAPYTYHTLSAVNPSLDREDKFFTDTSSQAGILQGVNGAGPPGTNPISQLEHEIIKLSSATGLPSNFSNVTIYKYGNESTVTSDVAGADFAYTTNPYPSSPVSIRIPAFTNGQYVSCALGSIDVRTASYLKLRIRLASAFTAANLNFSFKNAGVLVSGAVPLLNGQFGYSNTVTGSYLEVNIPKNVFPFTSSYVIDELLIGLTGANASGFQIADIKLQFGGGIEPPIDISRFYDSTSKNYDSSYDYHWSRGLFVDSTWTGLKGLLSDTCHTFVDTLIGSKHFIWMYDNPYCIGGSSSTTLQQAIDNSNVLTKDNEILLGNFGLDFIAGNPDYSGELSDIFVNKSTTQLYSQGSTPTTNAKIITSIPAGVPTLVFHSSVGGGSGDQNHIEITNDAFTVQHNGGTPREVVRSINGTNFADANGDVTISAVGRLGIEDNTGIQDRDMDMDQHYLSIINSTYNYTESSQPGNTQRIGIYSGSPGGDLTANGDTSFYAQISAINNTIAQRSYYNFFPKGLAIYHTGADTTIYKTPIRTGWGVASVNGIQPSDSLGNVVVSGGRFGIEDNTSVQDRTVDMSGFNFSLSNSPTVFIEGGNNTNQFSGLVLSSAQTTLYRNDDVTGNNSILSLPTGQVELSVGNVGASISKAIGISTTDIGITQTDATNPLLSQHFVVPQSGLTATDYYIPLSVNGNYANSAGDITVSTGRFGIEDNLGIQDRSIDMQTHDLFIDNTTNLYLYSRDAVGYSNVATLFLNADLVTPANSSATLRAGDEDNNVYSQLEALKSSVNLRSFNSGTGDESILEVNNLGIKLKPQDITGASNGDVWTLTDNSDGTGHWAAPSGGGSGWGLTGNAGTTAGTNFIGTTDAQDLVIKINGTERTRFINGGNISLGDFNTITSSGGIGIAVGSSNTITGYGGFTLGSSHNVSSVNGVAVGNANIVTGTYAVGVGSGLKPKSYGGVVVGAFNDSTNATSTTTYNTANRAFQIGIGQSHATRQNAMTVLFSGATQLNKYGIGTFTGTPAYTLQVDASGNVIEGLRGNTIYDANDTLSSDRVVEGNGKSLGFIGMPSFTVESDFFRVTNSAVGGIFDIPGNGSINLTTGSGESIRMDIDNQLKLNLAGSLNINSDEGTAGEVLTSQGAGAAPIWATAGGGSGTVNSGTANQLAYYAGTGTAVSGLTAITANRALISDANGLPTHSATTNTELGYVSGVTSAIQTQMNLKAPLASPTFTGTVTIPTPFTLGATSVTSTGTQLNYLNAATGTTGTTSTNLVFSTSPTFITPTLGAATATSINGNTFTTGTYTLTGVAGKTLTFNKSITLEGTDATTMTFPTTSATLARTDAGNSFTGGNSFSSITNLSGGIGTASTSNQGNFWANTGTSLNTTQSVAAYQINGVNSQFRVGIGGNSATTATAGNSVFSMVIANYPYTEATSGTSPLGGGLAIPTMSFTNGGGATTDFQNLWLGDAPTGGVNNWSLNAGATNFRSKSTYDNTVTAAGTTGNQTINKSSGTVNIAAAGTTVTVTNSLCTANSLVFAVIRTNDATARIANVVPAAGSFVINIVACTAEVSIGFFVIN